MRHSGKWLCNVHSVCCILHDDAPHTTRTADCDKHIEQQTDTDTFSHVYKWSMSMVDEYDKNWEIRYLWCLNRFVVAGHSLHDQITPLSHFTDTPGQIRTVTFNTFCKLKSEILHSSVCMLHSSHTSRHRRLVVARLHLQHFIRFH